MSKFTAGLNLENMGFSISANDIIDMQGINNELCELGHGNMGYGCLAEIRSELQKLNKGQIVAAMITASKQTSLESLKKFSDTATKYLEYEAINS